MSGWTIFPDFVAASQVFLTATFPSGPFFGKSVDELFSAHAVEVPDREAIVWNGGSLTYRELDEWSNQVATLLVTRGVEAGEPVALHIERSPEAICGLLGILKSGAIYVPIDPSEPTGRVIQLVRQTGIRRMLCRSEASHEAFFGVETIDICDAREALAIDRPRNGTDACYILFTSGSTGTAKAVCVPHQAVVRLVQAPNFARVGPEETWLHMAPMGFDASTLEIWAPLCNGGRLALMPSGPLALRDIGGAIARHRVTSAWLTSGLFRAMVDEELDALAPLTQLLTGGDVVPVSQARVVIERYPNLTLINGYGPTENTTFTCCHRISAEDCRQSRLPIGRPISGTEIHILSDDLTECPEGVAGELFAGGLGLAIDYWNDPGETSRKFINHSVFGRLYRTGDLCLRGDDGVVEFLGRLDEQVKIRGFRIEPAEVEAALASHPTVRQAVVVATKGIDGTARLKACVVPADYDEGALRSFLAERLPNHMVPTVWAGFASLPLTAQGKIDRAALRCGESPVRAPALRSESKEDVVREIWDDLLGAEGSPADRGFFECGGDSILLVRLHARLSKLSPSPLKLTDLFSYPTIRQQAVLLSGNSRARASASPRDRAEKRRAAKQGGGR